MHNIVVLTYKGNLQWIIINKIQRNVEAFLLCRESPIDSSLMDSAVINFIFHDSTKYVYEHSRPSSPHSTFLTKMKIVSKSYEPVLVI